MPGRVEPFAVIRAFLATVGRRLRRRAAARWALTAGAAAVLVAAVLPLCAAWSPTTLWSYLAIAGGLAVAAAFVAGGWILPRRAFRRDRELARFVGTEVTPIASDLMSSVELGTSANERFSPDLVAALVDSTARRVSTLSPEVLVPARPLRRPLLLFAAAVAAHGAVALIAPDALAAGWRALVSSPSAGPFEGADLSGQPLVGDVEIRLSFPAYTARPPVSLPAASGDFRAMPGTIAEIRTTALGPVARAQILFDATRGEQREPLDLAIDRGQLSGKLVVRKAGSYRFLIERPDRLRQVEAIPREIELEPDKPPQVELHAPADELDVATRKRVELAYLAEDDYGITKAELVWTERGKERRMPVIVPEPGRRAAQSKFLWDLADISLSPGIRITYHLEVFDNDDVTGPNVGKSRSFTLRVFSERERHEALIAREQEMFEHMVKLLGARLTLGGDDVASHTALNRDTAGVVVEIGTVIAALGNNKIAPAKLVAALEEMRGRLDKLAKKEAKVVAKLGRNSRGVADKLAPTGRALVAELEDDVIALADWLDRQQMENMLAITDEIATHQERIKKLLAEFKRTGSEEIKAELERELRALERRLAELRERRLRMPEDVLDQFMNADAMPGDKVNDCLGEVKALLDAGDVDGAMAMMEKCSGALSDSADALERALDSLRDDKFSEQQKKLDQQLSELADLAKDQDEIAREAADIYDRYAERAAEMMRDKAGDMRRDLKETVDKLESRLDKIPEAGLTPFSKEELAAVRKRLKDLDSMLADGDVAEALAMARQTEASLEMMEAELAANMDEDGQWNAKTPEAHRQVEKAQPLAQKLVDELARATPSPRDILSSDDRKQLDKLRRRQQSALQRARKMAQKASEAADQLPGKAGEALSRRLGEAGEHMHGAEERMRVQDPSGAKQQARDAATKLNETRKEAQSAARMAQQGGQTGLRDEPVRIPGADEYRPPQAFREDILEAMKKDAPSGFQDMVRRYYEELIK